MADTLAPASAGAASFRFSAAETLKHVVLILGAVIVLLPFYVMVSYSLKSPAEIMQNSGGPVGSQELFRDDFCVELGNPPEDCLVRPAIYNYTTAFEKAPLLRYLLNGVIVTVSIFLIQVIVALPCAYALAKLRFWGREAVFGLVLFCLLIPVHAIALPLYIMLAKLGLTNSYAALIVPWTISVFGIFLMRQFFKTVPDDLIDAARRSRASGLRHLQRRGALERLLLAAHRRHRKPRALHAAARPAGVQGRRRRRQLRSDDGDGLHHRHAPDRRLPAGAAAVHRGHHPDRNEIEARSSVPPTRVLP